MYPVKIYLHVSCHTHLFIINLQFLTIHQVVNLEKKNILLITRTRARARTHTHTHTHSQQLTNTLFFKTIHLISKSLKINKFQGKNKILKNLTCNLSAEATFWVSHSLRALSSLASVYRSYNYHSCSNELFYKHSTYRPWNCIYK